MYYILIIDGKAHESIPEHDSAFPGIPVDSRYSKDILSKCVQSETPVQSGWLYDPASGTFSTPPEPEPVAEPEPEPETNPEPTTEEVALDLLAEHEERLCMLELTK